MSVRVANSRFITSSLKGLYKYLTYHLSNFQALGERIIHEAEVAQAFRQTEKLEELGLILTNFPLKEYRLAGQYYIGWCLNRKGRDAQKLFERIAEESATYRPMALIELATTQAQKGDLGSGITYYTEALKYSQTPYTVVLAERSIAAVKGIKGDHKGAIKGLERIAPLVRYSQPVERYQYLNSLAVELAEVGRIEEANNVCKIVLASPYAFAYPEWHETGAEVVLMGYKSRSLVRITETIPKNLLYMPEPPPATEKPVKQGRARLFSLEKWKKKMVKEPNGEEKNLDDMNDKDLFMELMRVASEDSLTSKQLRKMVDAVKKIASESKD